MKKILFVLEMLFIAITSNSVRAQWVPGTVGTTHNLTGVSIPEGNSSFAWAVGHDSSDYMKAALYKSTDSGVSWTTINTFPANFGYPTNIGFADGNTGIVSGVGGLIVTYDGGSNWSYLYQAPSGDTVVFVSFGIGPLGSMWAIGNKISNGQFSPAIIRSAKGLGSFDFKRLTLPPSWTYQPTSLCAKDSNNCVISTNTHSPSVMLRTTNGGTNWTEISFSSSLGRDFWSLVGSDVNDDLFVVGGYNGGSTIFRSSDFGSNWSMIYDNPGGRLLSIGSPFGYIRDTMYAVGETGTILRTIDRGTTWIPQTSGSTGDLNSVSMGHHLSQLVITVGDHGTMLKTTNGGVTGVERMNNSLPTGHSLAQNYPNPFNPSTVIKYQVTGYGQVSLKVFDLLGREVATLVTGMKAAGSYSVEWNAAQIVSGVYFCRFTAGSSVETKKMTLLK